MDSILQDLRFSLRALAKHKGFTAIAVLCLALGIGVNTTIFSLVNAMLLRPFPYRAPEELMSLRQREAADGAGRAPVSYPTFNDWRAQATTFSSMGAYTSRSFVVLNGEEPERIAGAAVNATTFPTLGIGPVLGRGFSEEEDRPNAEPVVLISHEMWESRFGLDPKVVGQPLSINGRPHTIVGVMPTEFAFPGRALLWTPLALDPTENRGSYFLDAVGRLKPGVTIERAGAELSAIQARLRPMYPAEVRGFEPVVETIRDREVGQVRPALFVLQGAVLLVLLIACANVANLLLAKATSRHREIAIRTTLGARRSRIVRQLLTESVIVAVLGAAFGTLLAMWGLDLLVASIPVSLPFWMKFEVDSTVLLFTLGVAVATGLVFGLVPAMQASRSDLQDALKDGGRGAGAGRKAARLRSGLVVAEVALSLVLLVGAGLMMKSFLNLQVVDPGFDTKRMLVAELSFSGPEYDSLFVRQAAMDQVEARVRAIPGVEAVGMTSLTPLSNANSITGVFLESQVPEPGEEKRAEARGVSPAYFLAAGVPMLRGRTFTTQEVDDSARVVVVGRTFAERYWPGEEAIGKRLRFGGPDAAQNPLFTVVGIVGDTKQATVRGEITPQIYFTPTQWPGRGITLAVRAGGDPAALAASVRAAIRAAAPTVPVNAIRTMREVYARFVWQDRLYGSLFTVFATIALVLAALGVYSVISYSVAQRTREIGVRMALGAQRGHVFRQVVNGGVGLTLVGVAIGLAGAVGLTRVLESMLFGVSATDPIIFVAVPMFLLAIAAAASYVPARRAAIVDPAIALRNE